MFPTGFCFMGRPCDGTSPVGNTRTTHFLLLSMDSGNGIYIIVNKMNGHRYVGQTNNFHRRWKEHRSRRPETRTAIGRAFVKHGKESFTFMVLEKCPIEKMDEREIHYISTMRPEYNMNSGGTGNRGHLVNDYTRKILSKIARRWWDGLPSDEKKIIISRLKPNRRGSHIPESTKKKMSDANKKFWFGKVRPHTELEKRKISMANKISMIGNQNGIKIRVDKICSRTMRVIETFGSAAAASRSVGVHPSGITHVCRGKQSVSGGFFWRYHKNQEVT